VRSLAAGERVLASVTRYLEEHLKLRVNRSKSAVASVKERKFLGHRLLEDGTQTIAAKSLERAQDRVREITRRNGSGPSRSPSSCTAWVSPGIAAGRRRHAAKAGGGWHSPPPLVKG